MRIMGLIPSLVIPPEAMVPMSLLGEIPAGRPGGAEERAEACITVSFEALDIPRNARCFALRVRGDSMINAHIVDGDLVILELKPPHDGAIVAALIDGEAVLKRYMVRDGKPYLRAENSRYKELTPAQELVIQGVLRARGSQSGSVAAMIVHLDADAFYASVEQAADVKLLGKAMAVGGQRRGIIASASYEARKFGVYTPMPTARARKICPKLIVVPGDYQKYEQFSRFMFSFAEDFTPTIERGFRKYGNDHSAIVGGFSTFQARSALAEVAKVLGVSDRDICRVTEHLPHTSADGIAEALQNGIESREACFQEEPYSSAIRLAGILDGFPRHPKMHPCGVVISRDRIHEHTPTFPAAKNPRLASRPLQHGGLRAGWAGQARHPRAGGPVGHPR